jgi:hypothetical protein
MDSMIIFINYQFAISVLFHYVSDYYHVRNFELMDTTYLVFDQSS